MSPVHPEGGRLSRFVLTVSTNCAEECRDGCFTFRKAQRETEPRSHDVTLYLENAAGFHGLNV